MPKLVKLATTTYIPGDPGSPGSPYVPAQPARTVVEPVTVCGFSDPVSVVGGVTYMTSGFPTYDCVTENQLVYYPATGAVAAVPYSPPTAAQTIVSLNQGWNSYARTIETLDLGTYIAFTVKPGTQGALMALGPAGMEGVAISNFSHGVMVDTSGIYVFESGAVAAQLASTNDGSEIRITRMADGRIAYSAGGIAVISTATVSTFETLYVYGMLYSAYDEVSSTTFAALAAGVSETTVVMAGAGDLKVSINGPAVVMAGYGDFTTRLETGATMSGAGGLVVALDGGGSGSVSMLAMLAHGGDSVSELVGYGYAALPRFTASGSEAAFVPAQPTVGYVNLPFLTAWGEGIDIEIGSGSVSLPLFVAQASEGEYGIGNASLPLFVAAGYAGFLADDEMMLFSTGIASTTHAAAIDLVLVLNSAGELASSFSMTRAKALELLSVLQQSDSFAMLGVYGYSLLSGLHGLSLETLSVNSRPDLHDGGAVWVVNLDTSASAQYAHYGFNSFFRRGDSYYGVANDGIYKLEGANDAGNPIEALIEFANTNLGSTQAKRMSDVYLAASGNSLVLKVVTQAGTNYYTARWGGAGMQNQRVHPGKGLQSVYWQFGVANQNGSDFELAGLEFLPIVTQRRVV